MEKKSEGDIIGTIRSEIMECFMDGKGEDDTIDTNKVRNSVVFMDTTNEGDTKHNLQCMWTCTYVC